MSVENLKGARRDISAEFASIIAKEFPDSPNSTDKSLKKELLKSAAKVIFVGGAAGIAGVAGITARHHRELTHDSLKLSRWLQKAIDAEQRSLGVKEPYTWASVHRIHHQMEDASLYPFYRTYHAVNEAKVRGIELPKKVEHLDPFAQSFDLEMVMKIGESADALIQERLGDKYKKPEFADDQQIWDIMHPTEPQYHYPEYTKKSSAADYTADELARIITTDPHSPALMEQENGVKGVAVMGIHLYKTAADAFRYVPSLKPLDLQRPEDFISDEDDKKKTRKAVLAGFAIPAAAMFLANRDYTLKGAGRAVLEGAAINGVRAATELLGGNVTNSAGHMGDPVQTEIAQAFLNQKYEIKLKPDGTITTNTVGKGITGRIASWATLDEVGGQEIHHRAPWKIKYTDKEGREAWIEAPWGSLLEYLADNEKASFIQRGDNFDGKEKRPDVIHEAVQWIRDARAAQYALDHTNGKV